MLILSLISYFLGRFAFRIIFTVFGWAVDIFMGKTSRREEVGIYSFTGLSLLWVYVLVWGGIFGRNSFGTLGTEGILRDIAIWSFTCGIFILPIGGGLFICGKRESLGEYALSGLKGFFYCPVMAGAFVLMVIFGIIITAKRFFLKETALFIEVKSSMGEKELAEEVLRVLEIMGEVRIFRASLIYSLPNRLFSVVTKEKLFPKREVFVRGEGFGVFFNKDDLMIEGCKDKCHAVKIKLTKELMTRQIYFAREKEGIRLEKCIQRVYEGWCGGLYGEEKSIVSMERLMDDMERLSYEDWIILRLRVSVCMDRILEEARWVCLGK